MAVIFLNAVGNLSLAYGMKHTLVRVAVNPFDYVRAMLNPFVALGICLLVLWLLTRMALLSWADLSYVLPLMAVGYILAAALGKIFLQESLSSGQWSGTLLIFCGAVVVGGTGPNTSDTEPSQT